MNERLADAWAKLDWAKRHADRLKPKIRKWIKRYGKTIPFDVEANVEEPDRIISIRIRKVPDIPQSWALIAGDALFCFRASLDYLAWQLVAVGSDPNPKSPESIYFPIVMEAKDWISQSKGRLPGLRDEHRAVLEKYQPYSWGQYNRRNPLAGLHELSRADRHRQIQLAYAKNVHYHGEIKKIPGFIVERVEAPPGDAGGFIKKGTEMARLYVRPSGEPPGPMKMALQGEYIIAFENRVGVEQMLFNIGAIIATMLTEFDPLF